MMRHLSASQLAILTLITLVGCSGAQTSGEKSASSTTVSTSAPSAQGAAASPPGSSPNPSAAAQGSAPAKASAKNPAAIAPGVYCYRLKTPTLSEEARLTVNAGNQVSGTLSGVVEDQANAYFTSYQQTVSGTLAADQAQMAIVTDIENSRQPSTENWIVTAEMVRTRNQTLTSVNCRELDQPTTDSTPPNPGKAGESTAIPEPVNFAPGKSSATLQGGVVRGDRKIYLLNAGKRQTMTLSISSLENNAVFDLIAPDGKILQQEATQATQVLPSTGDYQVVVGGTRGNTSYTLTVGIE